MARNFDFKYFKLGKCSAHAGKNFEIREFFPIKISISYDLKIYKKRYKTCYRYLEQSVHFCPGLFVNRWRECVYSDFIETNFKICLWWYLYCSYLENTFMSPTKAHHVSVFCKMCAFRDKKWRRANETAKKLTPRFLSVEVTLPEYFVSGFTWNSCAVWYI